MKFLQDNNNSHAPLAKKPLRVDARDDHVPMKALQGSKYFLHAALS